jgi:ribonuclease E
VVHKDKDKTAVTEMMVVNDSPGEECRIAILENGHLEELFTERTATATNVGNIYKGRVTNVEPAIQAAFVDYGKGQAGFLHITDLHPRYFPGGERSERVGKRTPRRERPPIQEALRRGDEILVQVLKQGIGTKGPTLTSYVSVPGRLLVMMPGMDRHGVSRKVEDEEKRRKMREILGSLSLPEGLGFILRTAGFDATKADLKRDAAYLTRLWQSMQKRINSTKAPCELYVESDLLIRTIRDILRSSISAIVVDSESAYNRAKTFLDVVAPRSAPKLVHYREKTPIFHAFDVERQIELIHSRQVPLPSGGALVFDQTEALVAIDVNSGKSTSARDAETNAYNTNCEAVDEICRQLRLRDLGGLIVNDLIDMRSQRHRREIEERFRHNLKRDRARSTIAHISPFGILEMTRQRMRPSLRKSHFMDCPNCGGHGEVKTPESVGADTVRQIGYLLQYSRVRRIELVCSPRVASVLLSGKRRELVGMEDATNKRVDVRVSDAIAIDRVDFYAYDDRNADIDIAALPQLPHPSLPALLAAQATQAAATEPDEMDVDVDGEAASTSRRRKRRRGRRRGGTDDGAVPDIAASHPRRAPHKQVQTTPSRDGESQLDEDRLAGAVDQPDPPMRVHELAKQLGVKSREIIERCRSLDGVDVKSHMSTMAPQDVRRVRAIFEPEPAAAPGVEHPSETQSARRPDQGQGSERGRRRRRRGRGRRGGEGRVVHGQPPASAEAPHVSNEPTTNGQAIPGQGIVVESTQSDATDDNGGNGPRRRRRRRRGRGRGRRYDEAAAHDGSAMPHANSDQPRASAGENMPPRGREHRSGDPRQGSQGTVRAADSAKPTQHVRQEPASSVAPKQPKVRALYRTRKKLSPTARAAIRSEGDD